MALQLLECSRALLLPRLELSSSSSSLRRRAAVAPWAFTWESLNCWSCAGPYISCNVCCDFCYWKATFTPSVWWNRYSRNETNSGCDHFYALHSCGFCFEVILLHSEWSSCVLRPSIKMEEIVEECLFQQHWVITSQELNWSQPRGKSFFKKLWQVFEHSKYKRNPS